MSFDDIRTGSVIRYPYLWLREAETGETEGRKLRPVVVGVRLPRPNDADVMLLFPITSHEPAPSRFAAEIPATEKTPRWPGNQPAPLVDPGRIQ